VIKAVVSDFGGVITLPLIEGFKRAHEELGIPIEALGKAMALTASRAPEPPLWTLERGQMTEPDFIAGLAAALGEVVGRPVDLDGYGARLMGELEANEELLAYYRSLRERGVRLAILTNNVREWHDAWRQKFAIDDLFELVVDSGFEGTRKPEPEIYALTLERLGLPGEACAFVDDLEVNLPPARAAGMHAIHFRETSRVIVALTQLVEGG
jgi:putative hydrolase of the HAD superfamily